MSVLSHDKSCPARPMSGGFGDLETACHVLQIGKQHSPQGGGSALTHADNAVTPELRTRAVTKRRRRQRSGGCV